MLLNNVEAHWALRELSGSAIDYFKSNTLTQFGTISSVPGVVDTAREFEASNLEYFEIANNASLSTGDIKFCFAGWIYLTSKTLTINKSFVAKFGNTGNIREYQFFYNGTTDRFSFIVSPDGTLNTTVAADTLGSPSTGQWYFFYVEHNPDTNLIGISINNGTLDTAAHSTGVAVNLAPFCLGRNQNGAYANAYLNSITYWKNRLLTPGERTQLYNGGAGLKFESFGFIDSPIGLFDPEMRRKSLFDPELVYDGFFDYEWVESLAVSVPAVGIKCTPVAPTSSKGADVPVTGLVKVTPLSPQRTWPVAVPAIPIKVTPVAPTSTKAPAFPVAPVKITPVSPTSSKAPAVPAIPVKVTPVAPIITRSPAVPVAPVKVTPVAMTTSKTVADAIGLVKITPVAPIITRSPSVPPAIVLATPVAPTSSKAVTFPVAPVKVTPVAISTTKPVANPVGPIKVTPVAPTPTKYLNVPATSVKITPVAPTIVKTVTAPLAIIDVLAIAPTATKAGAVPSQVVRVLGLPTESNNTAVNPVNRILVTPLAPSTNKPATAGQGLIKVTPIAPIASFSAFVGQGLIDIAAKVTEDTGWTYGSVADQLISGFGITSWTNPSNARLSDNVNATANLLVGTFTHYLHIKGLGFNLPADAEIKSVSIRYEGSASGGAGFAQIWGTLTYQGATIGSQGGPNGLLGSESLGQISYPSGGTDPLWGLVLTPATLNDPDFGVAVFCKPLFGSTTAFIDSISVRVSYATSPITVIKSVSSGPATLVSRSIAPLTTKLVDVPVAFVIISSLPSTEGGLFIFTSLVASWYIPGSEVGGGYSPGSNVGEVAVNGDSLTVGASYVPGTRIGASYVAGVVIGQSES
jgi:hypothetical protein